MCEEQGQALNHRRATTLDARATLSDLPIAPGCEERLNILCAKHDLAPGVRLLVEAARRAFPGLQSVSIEVTSDQEVEGEEFVVVQLVSSASPEVAFAGYNELQRVYQRDIPLHCHEYIRLSIDLL